MSDTPSSSKRLKFKVTLVGDEAVGKTALVHQAVYSQFVPDKCSPTTGVEFYQAEATLLDDVHVTLQLWDVGSHVTSLQMAANYLHGSDAVLVVYDAAQPETFAAARQWVGIVQQMFEATGPPLVALVANKADTPEQQQAAAEQLPLQTLGCSGACQRYCVSAMTGHNVQQLLQAVASQLAGIPVVAGDADPAAAAAAANPGNSCPAAEAHTGATGRRRSCCECFWGWFGWGSPG